MMIKRGHFDKRARARSPISRIINYCRRKGGRGSASRQTGVYPLLSYGRISKMCVCIIVHPGTSYLTSDRTTDGVLMVSKADGRPRFVPRYLTDASCDPGTGETVVLGTLKSL